MASPLLGGFFVDPTLKAVSYFLLTHTPRSVLVLPGYTAMQ